MSGKTPKTGTVRFGWASGHPSPNTTNIDERLAEFDRWLAAHDAEVLAAAGVTQPEPEYEYRLVLELHPPKHAAWDQAETLWYPTVEEARATGKARDWIAHYRIDYPRAKFTERVERRVVAGEAEPAPDHPNV